MNIYIKVEIKSRELESRLLLALVAAERGHSVLIGPQAKTIEATVNGTLKPGIVYDKSLTPGPEKIKAIRQSTQAGCIYTSQDEESGLLEEDYSSFARSRFSEETLDLVHKVFAWGEHDRAGIVSMYPGSKAKIVATGSPRVDLWRHDLSEYYTGQENGGLSNYILFPSNFAGPLDNKRMWQRLKFARLNGYFQRGVDEFSQYNLEVYRIELLKYFVKAIRSIAETFPDTSIVVRPHPVESEEAWAAHLGRISNVHVIKQGSINSWIKNSSVVVHNSCTSGIEAAVYGKPVIAYRPQKSEFEFEVPNKVSYQVETEQQLIKGVGKVLRTGQLPSGMDSGSIHDLICNRFANLEDQLAADRIVDEWEKLDNGQVSISNCWSKIKFDEVCQSAKETLGAIKRLATLNCSMPTREKNHKFPPITDAEIADIANRFRIALKRFDSIKVRLLDERVVLVEPG